MADRHEKTEKPTGKRRREAREKGQVARSGEVSSVAILMSGLIVFYFAGAGMVRDMGEIMRGFILESGRISFDQAGAYNLLRKILIDIASLLWPILIIPVVAIGANIMQVGILFTGESLKIDLAKLNPIEGIKRFFSLNALVELVKGMLKLLVIGYMAYRTIRGEMLRFGSLVDVDTNGILSYLGAASFRVFLMTSWVLIILAIIDYIYQRWEMERNLMMTKEEVKEELKDLEGNPLIKSRIRGLQREMARKRMMQEVPKATAIITNPTHIAVAIRYEQGRMRAPVVVAKGAGILAERIKEIAKEHDVPMVENKPLARILYRTVKIGREIPSSLYKAVAEVLAYVYSLKLKRLGR